MKKIAKLFIIAVLAIVTALSMVGCYTPGDPTTDTGLLYKKIGGVYTIYDYVDDGTGVTVLDIADELESGITDVRIKTNAFSGNDTLVKIIVPDTVTLIDKGAFAGMKKLQELEIPYVGKTAKADVEFVPVEEAGKSVGTERTVAHLFGSDYYDAGALVTINYDSANSAETCYMPLSLKKIVVAPTTDYSIPMYAFSGLNKEVTVEMNENVVAIGEGAFKGCSQMQSITIPDSVTEIYKSAFENCTKLSTVNFGANVEVIGQSAFKGCALTNVSIPEKVEKIENYCFAGSSIKTVTLSSSLICVGHYAFYDCVQLEKVYTDNVTANLSLGVFAFANCSNLTFMGKESEFVKNQINVTGYSVESTTFMNTNDALDFVD